MKKRALSIFTTWSLLVTLAGLLSAPSARAQGFDNNQDEGQGNKRPLRFTVTDLGTLGGMNSHANAINNRGQVVGYSTLAGEVVTRAFLWEDGVMTDLGTLGGTFSDSAGINNRHRIVGTSTVASGQQHAYIFSKAKMTDLNELIPADSGWTLVAATGINDVGEIVGNGRINGQPHAFLLTPDDDDED